MRFFENRLVRKDPETGGDTGHDVADVGDVDVADIDVGTGDKTTDSAKEAKKAIRALDKEVKEKAKKDEAEDADKVADSVETENEDDKKKSEEAVKKEDAEKNPIDRATDYFGSDEFKKDKGEGKWGKIIMTAIVLFLGIQKTLEGSASTEEIDVKRAKLVTAYTALIAEFVAAGKLPSGITVDGTDIGVLSGEYAISTIDDLEKHLEGKVKMETGNVPITLRDYMEKIEERENPAPAVVAAAGVGAVGATTEAVSAVPPPLKGPKGDVDLVGDKTCCFKLANGGEVILGNRYIEMGGKRFTAKAKSDSNEADISFEKVRLIANGGYAITIKPALGLGRSLLAGVIGKGGPREVSLDQAKIISLISTLYGNKDQQSFPYSVTDPETKKNVEFTFTAA